LNTQLRVPGFFGFPFENAVMTIKGHYQAIINALEGQTDQLRDIPAARRDWAGTGTVIQLFESTSGKNRAAFIDAVGQVIENHPLAAPTIAELIHIACSLDLAQVEPQVRKLQVQKFAAQEDVKKAITNYLALRTFSAAPVTPVRPTARITNPGSKSRVDAPKCRQRKSRQSSQSFEELTLRAVGRDGRKISPFSARSPVPRRGSAAGMGLPAPWTFSTMRSFICFPKFPKTDALRWSHPAARANLPVAPCPCRLLQQSLTSIGLV
jgi:hypothetical protein